MFVNYRKCYTEKRKDGGNSMKILIAPDSFKGSLNAIDVARAMQRGVQNTGLPLTTSLLPVGDGGEGTVETLVAATNGKIKEVQVTGPLGNPVNAMYGILGDQKTCVIEVASASGLDLVPVEQLNPLKTTTYGVGELIKQALDEGLTSFILALGGSATNDGGAGMLQALGAKLLKEDGKPIQFGGGQLDQVNRIDRTHFDQRIQHCNVLIASDVQNPLIGLNGASHIFGPQKGATPEIVERLDKNMKHWANSVEKETGISLHNRPGAGAAGGIGGAFLAFFPAKMQRGIDVVLDYIHFNHHLTDATLVLTGEGQVDGQTESGKTPFGVAQAANKAGVPTIILAGAVGDGIEGLYDHGVVSIHSILNKPMSLEAAMTNAGELIEKSTEQVIRSFFYR